MNSNVKIVFDFLSEHIPENAIPRCDALFIFGSTTGEIAKHAAHLYFLGKTSKLIITGSHRHDKNEGPFGFASEAEYLASIAYAEGVPTANVLLETKSKNTYENVMFGMETATRAGLRPKTLVLVSIPYLLRRAVLCFKKNFPNITTYGSAMPVADDFFTSYRLERIKGELPRLIKYAEMGTIAASVIPTQIEIAARQF